VILASAVARQRYHSNCEFRYLDSSRHQDTQTTKTSMSPRYQIPLAFLLALIAGYVDSYSVINYKVFASFMSGNTTMTGVEAGRGNLLDAARDLLPIPSFVAGIFIGTFILHCNPRHPLAQLFTLVAVLLTAAIATQFLGSLPVWINIVMLSLAMGIMNTTITRAGAQALSLGYVTGDLNYLGQHIALAVKREPLADAQHSRDTHTRRAALLAAVWTAFFLGTLIAGAIASRFTVWTLVPPTLILLTLAAVAPRLMPARSKRVSLNQK